MNSFERDDFGDAQPSAVGGGECRLVLWSRCCLEQQRDLLDAQQDRFSGCPFAFRDHRFDPGRRKRS